MTQVVHNVHWVYYVIVIGVVKYDKLKKPINDNILRQFFAKHENIVGTYYIIYFEKTSRFLYKIYSNK